MISSLFIVVDNHNLTQILAGLSSCMVNRTRFNGIHK